MREKGIEYAEANTIAIFIQNETEADKALEYISQNEQVITSDILKIIH